MRLQKLFEDKENTTCPQCGIEIAVIPTQAYTCSCGWKKDPAPPCGTYLQFGQRYSELARMIPHQSVPGINGGRVS